MNSLFSEWLDACSESGPFRERTGNLYRNFRTFSHKGRLDTGNFSVSRGEFRKMLVDCGFLSVKKGGAYWIVGLRLRPPETLTAASFVE